LETYMDATSAQGVAHINPAGNLSGSSKLYKHQHPAGATTDVAITVPRRDHNFFGLTVLWRDPGREVEASMEWPDGTSTILPEQGLLPIELDGLTLVADRTTSPRGTVKIDVFVFSDPETSATVPTGDWILRMTDRSAPGGPPLETIAYVRDDLSGWGPGIAFVDHVSEDHLIGFPATADTGIPVAAYTGVGYDFGVAGERAFYSGRGFRIDGRDIMSVAAPDDPVSATFLPGQEGALSPFGGTSGASPHVAGVAALVQQHRGGVDGVEVRDAIENGAEVDDQVGDAPNGDWGHGKLRAYRAVYGGAPPPGTAPTIEPIEGQAQPDVESVFSVDVSDPDDAIDALTIEADLDYDGTYDTTLSNRELVVTLPEEGTQRVKLRVTDPTGRSATALAHIEVVPGSDDGQDGGVDIAPPSPASADDGCGCRVHVPDQRPPPFGWIAVAAAAWLRSRRRRT
ncbi:MAG: S8 family serine peptidase, partial [Myxococcota bacterium]